MASASTGAPRLRAGVVGAGVFGGYHSGKYAALDSVDFIGVCDLDLAAAEKVVAKVESGAAFNDLEVFLDSVDIVTVAAPASVHAVIAEKALAAGKHVLVEKPIALTAPDAERLIALAAQKGLALQVGHQERYVFEEFGVLGRAEPPLRLTSVRAGPCSGRGMDVSVVYDLMIHDLDLVRQLAPSEVKSVSATAKRVHGSEADEVEATLVFENGSVATLLASRLRDARERTMSMTYADGAIDINFLERRLTNTTPEALPSIFEEASDPMAASRDPLGYGVRAFVNSAMTGARPKVAGEDGLRALELAIAIEEKAAG